MNILMYMKTIHFIIVSIIQGNHIIFPPLQYSLKVSSKLFLDTSLASTGPSDLV